MHFRTATKRMIRRYGLVMCLVVAGVQQLSAQKHLELLNANPQITPDELISEFEVWSKSANPETARRHRKHLQRWLMANGDRYSVPGQPVNEARKIWDVYRKHQDHLTQAGQRSVNGSWIDYTPDTYSNTLHSDQGRTMCIAVHPDNPSTLYLGAGSGGLWRGLETAPGGP